MVFDNGNVDMLFRVSPIESLCLIEFGAVNPSAANQLIA